MQELYKKYRPQLFKQVLGQPDAIKVLEDLTKTKRIPHTLLLTGASGVGKTTLARILKTKLNCGDQDFTEVNCADFRGIDMVRDIRQRMGLAPISGDCRIWLIDEVHAATKDAQSAFLKILEDTPKHVYFMLATTDPSKLLKTIITRCTEIKLKPLTPKNIEALVNDILLKENKKLPEEVMERLIEVADGSARKALVILNQIIGLEEEEEQLDAIQSSDSRRQAIEIARLLIDPRTKWPDIAKVLKEIEDEPESIRHLVLAYAANVLLAGGKSSERAFLIVSAFEGNFYDSKKAGLVRACWEVIAG